MRTRRTPRAWAYGRAAITAAALGLALAGALVPAGGDAVRAEEDVAWQPAEVRRFESRGLTIHELRAPYGWATPPVLNWFDNDVILFNGVSPERLARFHELREQVKDASPVTQTLYDRRSGAEQSFAFNVAGQRWVYVADGGSFCYDALTGNGLIALNPYREDKRFIGRTRSLAELIGRRGFVTEVERDAEMTRMPEPYYWGGHVCGYMPQRVGGTMNKEETVQPLSRYDGFRIYKNDPRLPGLSPLRIADSDKQTVRELPLTWGELKWDKFAPWRNLYYSHDTTDGALTLSDNEEVPERLRWQQSNCLRFWWFDVKGYFAEECVPFVRGGVNVYPLKGGKVVVAVQVKPGARSSRRILGSTFYWAADGATTATPLFTTRSFVGTPDGKVSPDGCRLAETAWIADEDEDWPKPASRLVIIDACGDERRQP